MLTQERVKELFDYQDGDLIRRTSPRYRVKAGDVAGSLGVRGYWQVKIQSRVYLAHRVVWLWHNGYFSENSIDHIDRDKLNNRINNLREVSQQCNLRNTGTPADNTSGVKGVYWSSQRNKWNANIRINKKLIHLGCSKDFTEAVAHRLAAEQCIGWEGCDSSSPAFQYMKNLMLA